MKLGGAIVGLLRQTYHRSATLLRRCSGSDPRKRASAMLISPSQPVPHLGRQFRHGEQQRRYRRDDERQNIGAGHGRSPGTKKPASEGGPGGRHWAQQPQARHLQRTDQWHIPRPNASLFFLCSPESDGLAAASGAGRPHATVHLRSRSERRGLGGRLRALQRRLTRLQRIPRNPRNGGTLEKAAAMANHASTNLTASRTWGMIWSRFVVLGSRDIDRGSWREQRSACGAWWRWSWVRVALVGWAARSGRPRRGTAVSAPCRAVREPEGENASRSEIRKAYAAIQSVAWWWKPRHPRPS